MRLEQGVNGLPHLLTRIKRDSPTFKPVPPRAWVTYNWVLQHRGMRFTCEPSSLQYKEHVQSIMCRYVGTPRPVSPRM